MLCQKKKWLEWWKREGQYRLNSILIPQNIHKPDYSEKLAEFIGIVLGDGGISDYQVTITLHAVDDKKYGEFVVKLIKELFGVPVGIHQSNRAAVFNYVVSRIELVHFLEKLGLQRGDKVKHQIDLPNWIMEDEKYSISCVRGLVDTDGSVFTHHYRVSGKQYEYKKIEFTSLSKPMLGSVFHVLTTLGLHPRIARERQIWIDSKENVGKYFQVVGSHNPKHLKRYQN